MFIIEWISSLLNWLFSQEGFLFFVVVGLVLAAYTAVAFALSLDNICFTRGIEGAAKAVMKGGTFDHFLMWWQGHRPNDPRRLTYDKTKRPWEVRETGNPTRRPSLYAWWQLHWKWLELFGIYWYGLYPFKQIYVYKFKWTEQTIGDDKEMKPWRREESTDFIYVKNFSYWIKLSGAEDKDNEPLDLDYLITVHINNPYWALFRIEDWLGRISADANNKAKIYVGSNTFDQIKRESLSDDLTTSTFARDLLQISTNSVTEPGVKGTQQSYGVTVNAVSLVDANPGGVSKDKIIESFSARIVAERQGLAKIATAKANAQVLREEAQGKADAIETVYRKIDEFGNLGLAVRQMEAMETTAASPNNSTFVWANNPLDGFAKAMQEGFGIKPKPTTPPEAPKT